MMGQLKSMSREQITGVVAFLFALLFLVIGILPGGKEVPSGSNGLPAPGIRDFVKPPVLETRVSGSDFTSYWRGQDVFKVESSTRPPVPPIGIMFPHEDSVVPPVFRPHISRSVYNRLPDAWPLAGSVPSTALPDPGKLDALKSIVEPPLEEWVDQRAEREREYDILVLYSGSPREGMVISENADSVRLRAKDGNAVTKWTKDRIKKILRNWTNEERYSRSSAAIKKGVTEVEERLKLAAWCREKGMLPEARMELKAAVEVKPLQASAVLALGNLLEFQSDFETAVKLYRDSLDRVPSIREELHWRIGGMLRQLGLYGAALRAFEEGVDAVRTPRGILAYAEMLLRTGQVGVAVETVKDCQRKFNRDKIRFTPVLRQSAASILGRAQLFEGDFQDARKNLKTASTPGGNSSIAAEAWNALGVCHAMEAKYSEASSAFVSAIETDQYRVEAWTNLATLYLLASTGDVAEELFAMARERDPSDHLARNSAALPVLLGGDPETTKSLLASLLEAAPDDIYANYLQGVFSLRNGDGGEAYGFFRRALQADFNFVPAYRAAGRSCLLMGAGLERIRLDGDTTPERARIFLGPELPEVLGDGDLLDPEKVSRYLSRLLLQSKTFYERWELLRGGEVANLQVAYGCLDALSGRGQEAGERFREAKALNIEAGNPADPVIEYGFGYVHYRFGTGTSEERLTRARRFFRAAGNASGWTDAESVRIIAEAARMEKEIEDWRVTSLIEDEDFSREDSDHLQWRGSQWIEEDGPPRASIVLKGNECLISGTPMENMILTRLERDDLPSGQFNRLDVTFRPGPQDRTSFEFGVSFYDPARSGNTRMGLHIGFDLRRKIRQTQMAETNFLDERSEMLASWKEVKLKFPLPKVIRMRFQKVLENRRTTLRVLLWRPEKEGYEEVGKLNLRSSRSGNKGMKISFWARGLEQEEFSLGLDDIRILEKRKR